MNSEKPSGWEYPDNRPDGVTPTPHVVQRWEKFTLLDVGLLVLCLAAGIARYLPVVRMQAMMEENLSVKDIALILSSSLAFWGLATAALQMLRGRRKRPSFGEFLWLAQGVIAALDCVDNLYPSANHVHGSSFEDLALVFCMIVVALINLVALTIASFKHEFAKRGQRWSAWFGYLPGVWLLLILGSIFFM